MKKSRGKWSEHAPRSPGHYWVRMIEGRRVRTAIRWLDPSHRCGDGIVFFSDIFYNYPYFNTKTGTFHKYPSHPAVKKKVFFYHKKVTYRHIPSIKRNELPE